MSQEALTKKFTIFDESNQELAFVTLEQLWADVYGLKYKRIEWRMVVKNALVEAENLKVRQVAFRLIKDEYSKKISQILPSLGLNKKSERVEFKNQVSEMPDNLGSPMIWRTALEMNWRPQEVARIIKIVALTVVQINLRAGA